MKETWTVLAPGPSIRKLTPANFNPPGPVVAVNLAVMAPLRVDAWCALDPPIKFKQLWEPLDYVERRSMPVLWCRDDLADDWHRHGFRVSPHPGNNDVFRATYLSKLRKLRVHMLQLTILACVSRVIGTGADRVEIWGVDMQNPGYAYGEDALNRSPISWTRRWQTENKHFEMAMQDWRDMGVEVVRRHPDVDLA